MPGSITSERQQQFEGARFMLFERDGWRWLVTFLHQQSKTCSSASLLNHIKPKTTPVFFSINLRRNKLCEREINEMARWNEGGNKGREHKYSMCTESENAARCCENAQIWGWMTFLLPYFSVLISQRERETLRGAVLTVDAHTHSLLNVHGKNNISFIICWIFYDFHQLVCARPLFTTSEVN